MSESDLSDASHAAALFYVGRGDTARLSSLLAAEDAGALINRVSLVETTTPPSSSSSPALPPPATGFYETTLLVHACRSRREDVVGLLLAHPLLDVNGLGSLPTHTSAFCDCVARGDLQFARLLARDARVDRCLGDAAAAHPALYAARRGDVAALRWLSSEAPRWGGAPPAPLEEELARAAAEAGHAPAARFLWDVVARTRTLEALPTAELRERKVRLACAAASTLPPSNSAAAHPDETDDAAAAATPALIAADDLEAVSLSLGHALTESEFVEARRALLAARGGGGLAVDRRSMIAVDDVVTFFLGPQQGQQGGRR